MSRELPALTPCACGAPRPRVTKVSSVAKLYCMRCRRCGLRTPGVARFETIYDVWAKTVEAAIAQREAHAKQERPV